MKGKIFKPDGSALDDNVKVSVIDGLGHDWWMDFISLSKIVVT